MSVVLLVLTADKVLTVGTLYLGMVDSPSSWLSLLYSLCGSLDESPNSAFTMAEPCMPALSSAASSPWDRGGVLWEYLISMQEFRKAFIKVNISALRRLIQAALGCGTICILVRYGI